MPNSVAKGRSRIALLAVLAVLASLFVLPAAPAGAAAATADAKATFTACPADAIPDAGFTDVTGSFAEDQIDCIAYYGVTQGTSATTYSPAQVVTRWQMALFLARAAGISGITVPAASDQGFTDIAGLPQATQDAINQIAALGISKGTSTTTFSPMDAVSRYQMALFLARWSDAAVEGPGGTEPKDVTPDGNPFADIGAVSFEAHTAILDLFEMGVTTGTTATTFSPFAAVTREQMAAFITRTLAHTNARPAGVSLQVVPTSIFAGGDVDVAISVRDSSFQPVANALVDVFQAALADKAKATKTDGTCDTAITAPTYGGNECTIDAADPDTDASGNITDTVSPASSVVWWAWTGTSGATFDLDTTQVASAEVTVSAAATDWNITDNVNKYATLINATTSGIGSWENGGGVKFGTTVTLTFQLVDTDGKAVAKAGEKIELGFSRSVDDAYKGDTIVMLTSDANGTASYSWTETDPDTDGTNDSNAAIIEWYINSNPSGLGIDDDTNGAFGADYVWEDDAAVATTTVAAPAAASYTTGSSLAVRATVYDQYGIGKSGVTVTFTNTGDGFGSVDRNTNSSGVATQTITKGTADSEVDTVTANAGGGALTDTVDIYFAETGAADASIANAQPIVVFDAANNTMVLGPIATAGEFGADIGDVVIVTYKDTDNFTVSGDPKLVADFEKALTGAEPSSLTAANYNPAGISAWTVTP